MDSAVRAPASRSPVWHLNRESTARGLALGLFIALLGPIGQTRLAAFSGYLRAWTFDHRGGGHARHQPADLSADLLCRASLGGDHPFRSEPHRSGGRKSDGCSLGPRCADCRRTDILCHRLRRSGLLGRQALLASLDHPALAQPSPPPYRGEASLMTITSRFGPASTTSVQVSVNATVERHE